MITKDYLFYVRYALSGLFIYRCKTNDPYHALGEMIYRSLEGIDRVTIAPCTHEREQFWIDNGYKIHEWKNKY